MTTKAFRAALCINSSNVYTIGEARSRLYRRFCIICCVLFSVDLFHLISTTVSNNRFYFGGAPLQQQTELQLLFGCCQQQAEKLVGTSVRCRKRTRRGWRCRSCPSTSGSGRSSWRWRSGPRRRSAKMHFFSKFANILQD